jgi:hypothetical protein
MSRKFLKTLATVGAVLLAVAQLKRPDLTNPPTDASKTLVVSLAVPADVAAILKRSCADCHSHETSWPWYSQVSPVSWWLLQHVDDARKDLNLSTWGTYSPGRKNRKLNQMCEQVEQKAMPLPSYLLLHPGARLSDADRARLCEWTKSLAEPEE